MRFQSILVRANAWTHLLGGFLANNELVERRDDLAGCGHLRRVPQAIAAFSCGAGAASKRWDRIQRLLTNVTLQEEQGFNKHLPTESCLKPPWQIFRH